MSDTKTQQMLQWQTMKEFNETMQADDSENIVNFLKTFSTIDDIKYIMYSSILHEDDEFLLTEYRVFIVLKGLVQIYHRFEDSKTYKRLCKLKITDYETVVKYGYILFPQYLPSLPEKI